MMAADLKDYVIKFVASVVIYLVGLFYAVVVYVVALLTCFRDGYRNIFTWKDRGSEEPPLHYNAWDAESRKNPTPTATKWNHAYLTVAESGLRFHYVYSGSVPSDITISDIDSETTQVFDNNNITTNRPKLLLCVHGYPECWFTWRYILRYFDKPQPDGIGQYFVVAVDMRGYGESDKPTHYHSYHRNLLSSDVKGIAKTLGYERFSLMGHDWGAVATYEVAKNYPKSLDKMIILNGPEVDALQASMARNPMQIFKSWYMFLFQGWNDYIGYIATKRHRGRLIIVTWAADLFIRLSDFGFLTELFTGKASGILNPECKLTDGELEMFKYGVRHSTTGPNNYYRALVWPFSEPGPSLLYPKEETSGDPLRETPIMIIWGDKDSFLSKNIAEISAKRLNYKIGSKVVSIEGASHWVQQDQPDEVIRHVVDFLKI